MGASTSSVRGELRRTDELLCTGERCVARENTCANLRHAIDQLRSLLRAQERVAVERRAVVLYALNSDRGGRAVHTNLTWKLQDTPFLAAVNPLVPLPIQARRLTVIL